MPLKHFPMIMTLKIDQEETVAVWKEASFKCQGGPGHLRKMCKNQYFAFLATHHPEGEEREPSKCLVCPLGVGGSREALRAVSATVCY